MFGWLSIEMYRMHPLKWIWIGLGFILIVFGGLWLMSRVWYPYTYGMPMFGWGLPFGIFEAFFILILIMFVFRLMFWSNLMSYRRRYWRGSGAEEILRERYARGELTKEQFDQMMHDLQRDRV
jgi:putative membrane protein